MRGAGVRINKSWLWGNGDRMRADAEKLIRAYYARFNARDVDGMLGLLAADVVHDVCQGARRKGKAAFRRFLARMNRCYRETVRGLVVMICPRGRRAAAEFKLRGRYLETDGKLPKARGQRYALPGGAFFEIRRGKIARVSNHYNANDWLRQIGARRRAK